MLSATEDGMTVSEAPESTVTTSFSHWGNSLAAINAFRVNRQHKSDEVTERFPCLLTSSIASGL